MAKMIENNRRELLYLLFFYKWNIKSVKNVEKRRLKKIDIWDESKGIDADLVDMCFKIVQGTEKIQSCGKNIRHENRLINSYLITISWVSQLFKNS